jgi:4-hydroxy-4-methyl-2-oxoglutarate aldolase
VASSNPPATVVADLLALGAATLGESGARTMAPRVKPAWAGARVAGPAVPVCCTPGDNLAIHVAVSVAPAGSVLAADVGTVSARGYWGEVLTTAAQARGISGLVIDGGVRDVTAIAAHGFAVFSSDVALPGATKTLRGSVGAPALVGGVAVEEGDWIVGDEDGVVVIPGSSFDEVLSRAQQRAATEAELFVALRNGKTTVELLGLDPSPVRRV